MQGQSDSEDASIEDAAMDLEVATAIPLQHSMAHKVGMCDV